MYSLFILFQLIPRRKMRVKVEYPKNRYKPQVFVTGRPKAVLSLQFHLFYVRCCSSIKRLNVLIVTLVCVQFIQFTKGN